MIQNLDAIRRFVLGGAAIFTLSSRKSNERKTFRVRKAEDVTGEGRPHGYYVDLLTGPDNTNDYHYAAYLWLDRQDNIRVKPNKEGWGEDAVKTIEWLMRKINSRNEPGVQYAFELQVEFHHEGRCGVCGRALTVPESIESGIGPICAGRTGLGSIVRIGLAAEPGRCANCGELVKKHGVGELEVCAVALGIVRPDAR